MGIPYNKLLGYREKGCAVRKNTKYGLYQFGFLLLYMLVVFCMRESSYFGSNTLEIFFDKDLKSLGNIALIYFLTCFYWMYVLVSQPKKLEALDSFIGGIHFSAGCLFQFYGVDMGILLIILGLGGFLFSKSCVDNKGEVLT